MADGDQNKTSSQTALRTALWLAAFVLLAFTLRTVFNAGDGFDGASQRQVFTGNDPYYDWRALTYTLHTGQNLGFDKAINYPEGNWNPNPPLYVWTTAPVAAVMAKMHVVDPVGTALNVMVGVWAALTVIPTYMVGRDLFGRKAGLWAAFFMAISAPHIQRTSWGYPRHEAIALFLIVLALAFLVRAFKALENREFVASWRKGSAISKGIADAVRSNRTALAYGALAGLAIAACASTWKGYPYALAILAIGLGFQLLVDHLRNRDSTAVFMVYMVATIIATFLPWVLVYNHFPNFLQNTVYPSLYVLAGMAVAGLVLVPTRDLPSILVFPALLLSGLLGLLLLIVVYPAAGHTIFSGLGYFNQSKLYGTIAEAQRPRLGEVAANFGFFSFLIAFWGLARVIKGAYKGDASSMALTAWAAVALFMTFAASRFLMNAAPVMSILIGYAIMRILGMIGGADVKRRFRSAHGTGFMGRSLKSLSWKSVAGVVLVGLFLVVPNVWTGVDAGMSTAFESQHKLVDYSKDSNGLYNHAPRFGAFGIDFELKSNGWLPSMAYLATQDTGTPAAPTPIEQKPGFVAWWDYGHWATGIGDHPTVADPFQSHYELAGRFLASDSEVEAMDWLALDILDGNYRSNLGHLSPDVESYLATVSANLTNGKMPWGYSYDPQYKILSSTVKGDAIFAFYDRVCDLTHTCVGYMAADSRMFPYDDPQTQGIERQSIFYAPVFLANKNPDDYLSIQFHSGQTVLTMHRYAADANGNSYELAKPTYVDGAGTQWVEYQGYAYLPGQTPLQGAAANTGIPLFNTEAMQVTQKFYSTMFARAFGGLTDQAAAGEGLSHWRVVQETLVNTTQAGVKLRDVALLQYYRGATVSGTLQDDAGKPLAGYLVGFQDGSNAVHSSEVSGSDGKFTVVAPFAQSGDLKLVVRGQDGSILFSDARADFQFTKDQAMAGSSLGGITLTIPRGNVIGHVYLDTDHDGKFTANDTALGGAKVSAAGQTDTSDPATGTYAITGIEVGSYPVGVVLPGYTQGQQTAAVTSGKTSNVDIAMTVVPSEVSIMVQNKDGSGLANVPVLASPGDTQGTTNSTGVASLSLDPGTYQISVDTNVTQNGAIVRYQAHGTLVVPVGGKPIETTIKVE